jgi:ring-1,2-phenylacetyl-CoA epoxidase subunit PaaC
MTPAASIVIATTPRVRYLLRIADTLLVHAQRLTEWSGHAPVLEEDIALSNMGLDLLGQARALLTHVGRLDGMAFDEDTLAFLREERDFLNLTLVELPGRKPSAHGAGGDFADIVLRNHWLAAWCVPLWEAAAASADAEFAGIAAKAVKEARYHREHNGDWVVRLGDGTAESARRLRAAVERAAPYLAELFAHDEVDAAAEAAGLGPARRALRAGWLAAVEPVFAEAGVALPAPTPFVSTGTLGRHSEHLGFLLAEMQSLPRRFPGGVW